MGTEPPVGLFSPRQMSRWKADEDYARVMGEAQWNMRWGTAGGIGMGMVGYQFWSAFKVLAQPLSVHGRDATGGSGSIFTIQFRVTVTNTAVTASAKV